MRPAVSSRLYEENHAINVCSAPRTPEIASPLVHPRRLRAVAVRDTGDRLLCRWLVERSTDGGDLRRDRRRRPALEVGRFGRGDAASTWRGELRRPGGESARPLADQGAEFYAGVGWRCESKVADLS